MDAALAWLRDAMPSAPWYKQAGWSANALDPKLPILQLSVAFSLAVFVTERYLDSRQLRRYRDSKAVCPDERIPADKFQKSLVYGDDKLDFGIKSSTIKMVIDLALIFVGFLPYVWDLGQSGCKYLKVIGPESSKAYEEIAITCAFFSILTLQSTLLDLPFSLYYIFVIEQKHGFNKNTLGLYLMDQVKMIALSIVIGSPVIAAVVSLARWGGPHYYLYVWAFMCEFEGDGGSALLCSALHVAAHTTLFSHSSCPPLSTSHPNSRVPDLHDDHLPPAHRAALQQVLAARPQGTRRAQAGHRGARFVSEVPAHAAFCGGRQSSVEPQQRLFVWLLQQQAHRAV